MNDLAIIARKSIEELVTRLGLQSSKFSPEYIAALLDNSGKITLKMYEAKRGKITSTWFKHHVSVASHYSHLINALAMETNGKVIKQQNLYICAWAVGPAYNLLQNIQSHLRVKQMQSEIVTEFLLDVYMGNPINKERATSLVDACVQANTEIKTESHVMNITVTEIKEEVQEPESPTVVYVGEKSATATKRR